MTNAPGAVDTELQKRARQAMRDCENATREYALEAQAALDSNDFSGAATACHRAYQNLLKADILRAMLR